MTMKPTASDPTASDQKSAHTQVKQTETDKRQTNKKPDSPHSPLLVLYRPLDINIPVINVVSGRFDLILNLVKHLPLLLGEQGKVEKHLVKLRHRRFKCQHVLVFVCHIIVDILDGISNSLFFSNFKKEGNGIIVIVSVKTLGVRKPNLRAKIVHFLPLNGSPLSHLTQLA